MSSTDADAQAQSDEQFAAEPTDQASVAAREMRKDVHTAIPATIRSFDPAKQTVTVQPAIKRVFVELGPQELPIFEDVPVVFPAGGSYVLTFPIAAGDECLLVFAERAIDSWWDKGGMQEPSDVRFHDYSDAIALVGVSSRPRFLTPAVNTSAVELRTRTGSLILRMDGTTIKLGITSPEHAAKADTLKALLESLCDQINLITVPTAVGPSGVPINAAAISAVKAQLGTILSQTVFVQP